MALYRSLVRRSSGITRSIGTPNVERPAGQLVVRPLWTKATATPSEGGYVVTTTDIQVATLDGNWVTTVAFVAPPVIIIDPRYGGLTWCDNPPHHRKGDRRWERWDYSGQQCAPMRANVIVSPPSIPAPWTALPWARVADKRWDYSGIQADPATPNALPLSTAQTALPWARIADKRFDYSGMQAAPAPANNTVAPAPQTALPPLARASDKRWDYSGTQSPPLSGNASPATTWDELPPWARVSNKRWDYSGIQSAPVVASITPSTPTSWDDLPPVGVRGNRRFDYAGWQAEPAPGNNFMAASRAVFDLPPRGRVNDRRWDYSTNGIQSAIQDRDVVTTTGVFVQTIGGKQVVTIR